MTDIFVFENYFGPSVSNTFHTTHLCIPDTTYMDTFQTHLKPSTHLLHPHKRILCFQAFEILTKLFCLCKTWTFPGNSGSISGYLSAITEINFIQDNRRFHTNERENKTWSSVSNSSFLFVFNYFFGFKFNPRPAVLTISILVGDNCHQDKCCMCKCLCGSCPQILFL